jgi:hypothetical protein
LLRDKDAESLTRRLLATKALSTLSNENDPEGRQRVGLQRTLAGQEQNLEIFESGVILNKARRRAIEIPNRQDKPHWWSNDNDDGSMPGWVVTYWLNQFGRTGLAKLINEERKRNVEWWVKIATPLLTALISLLGLVVALVTVSRR